MKKFNAFLIVCALISASVFAGPPGSGWTLKFQDGFSNMSGKWNIVNRLDYNKYGKTAYYRPANVRIDGGWQLAIDNKWHNPRLNGADYTGGRLESYQKFTYGYFEVRCRVGWNSNQIWPTFWSLAGGNEFDIMEYNAKWSATPSQTHHWGNWTGKTTRNSGTSASSMHLWAMLWTYNEVSFFVDGVKRFSSANPAAARGLSIPLWLTSSPNRELQPAKSGSYPSFYVDIVSVWQGGKAGTMLEVSPTATINIYPNPVTNGTFNISGVSAEENVNVSLVNINGQTVYTELMSGADAYNISLNQNNISKGIYFVTVNSLTANTTQKIVVE